MKMEQKLAKLHVALKFFFYVYIEYILPKS